MNGKIKCLEKEKPDPVCREKYGISISFPPALYYEREQDVIKTKQENIELKERNEFMEKRYECLTKEKPDPVCREKYGIKVSMPPAVYYE